MDSETTIAGLRQRELCDRLYLNYRVVALSAKQLQLSTHAYLQQETGWLLYQERYYPVGLVCELKNTES